MCTLAWPSVADDAAERLRYCRYFPQHPRRIISTKKSKAWQRYATISVKRSWQRWRVANKQSKVSSRVSQSWIRLATTTPFRAEWWSGDADTVTENKSLHIATVSHSSHRDAIGVFLVMANLVGNSQLLWYTYGNAPLESLRLLK